MDTVMLTSSGGEMVPSLIHQLKQSTEHDIRVLAIDAGSGGVSRHMADEFWTVPFGDDPGYADAVLQILRETDVDLLVPCSDEEALSLSSRRGAISDTGCQLACVDHGTLEVFSDKARCYAALAENGIGAPVWQRADDRSSLVLSVGEIVERTGACVVKPARGRGGRDVFVVDSEADEIDGREQHLSREGFMRLCDSATDFPFPLIVMERLAEPVFDVDMLAWEGRPIHVVPRRRVNSQLPNEGHLFVEAPELRELGERLIEVFALSWLYDCDVMYDRDSKPQVLEINPRPSGSAAVTVAAGVPLFENLVALAKGEAPMPGRDVSGTSVLPYKSLLRV
jgi:predicted ATP-grasp superfamily ATP-dependent carboligase